MLKLCTCKDEGHRSVILSLPLADLSALKTKFEGQGVLNTIMKVKTEKKDENETKTN